MTYRLNVFSRFTAADSIRGAAAAWAEVVNVYVCVEGSVPTAYAFFAFDYECLCAWTFRFDYFALFDG